MTKKAPQVHEIDWKPIGYGAALPSNTVLKRCNALVLHVHTPQHFIDAMKQLKHWRTYTDTDNATPPVLFDKPVMLVHDDRLNIATLGVGAGEESPEREAYLIYLTKKIGPDSSVAKTVFDASMKQPSTLVDRLLETNPRPRAHPRIAKPTFPQDGPASLC